MLARHARDGRRVRTTMLTAAALGMCALATAGPAGAANPPTAPHSIISFPQRDFVSATGFDPGDEVVVDVLRNGHLLATSTPVAAQDDPKVAGFDGLVEVNHPGGGCWIGATPDIRPGDDVRTTVVASGAQDATTTANVTAEAAIEEGGNIVVHGTADAGGGHPLPLDQIEQRIVANRDAFDVNGRRTLRAGAGLDGTLAYDGPDTIHWTATYEGLDAADIDRAQGAETRILWLGADPAAGVEATIYETSATPAADGLTGGPALPDCDAPAATTAVIHIDHEVVNAANASSPVVLDGVSTPDITGVELHVAGGSTQKVAPTADGTWQATVPAEDLAALGQGAFGVVVHYVSDAGIAPPDELVTLRKDTIAPAAPHATPAGGPYRTTQVVTLAGEPGAAIHYTNDGSEPTAQSPRYTNPLVITATQTISAIAVDAAGNASPVGAFGFTITGATPAADDGSAQRSSSSAVSPAAATQQPVAAPLRPVAPSAALRDLALRRIVSRARLRSGGLRLSVTAGSAAHVVRVRLFRGSRAAGRPVLTAFRVPTRTGRLAVTLRGAAVRGLRPGRHVVEVAGGDSAAELGAPLTGRLTVTR